MKLNIYLWLGMVFLLASCGTSKSVKDLMNSYQYGIKKVHIENKNSTYDNLVSDFYENLKSTDQKFAEKIAKDTMLYMRKGPCLGHCPVYSITIYNNGNIKYDGVVHVDLVGIYESKLEEGQEEEIRALINKIDLPRMYSRHPRSVEMVADVARTNLLISDGVLKYPTLISYDEPEELTNLQKYLEEMMKNQSWVQI